MLLRNDEDTQGAGVFQRDEGNCFGVLAPQNPVQKAPPVTMSRLMKGRSRGQWLTNHTKELTTNSAQTGGRGKNSEGRMVESHPCRTWGNSKGSRRSERVQGCGVSQELGPTWNIIFAFSSCRGSRGFQKCPGSGAPGAFPARRRVPRLYVPSFLLLVCVCFVVCHRKEISRGQGS